MEDYKIDLLRPLDWQRNKSVAMKALLEQKSDWFKKYHTTFWENWTSDVFNLKTATKFGLIVWCYILDLPVQAFVSINESKYWAFGANRKNFHNEQTGSIYTDGGNLVEDGQTPLLDEEARNALRIRYYSLILGNTIVDINAALRDVFGVNADGTQTVTCIDNQDMTITYRHGGTWSSKFTAAAEEYDILPRPNCVKVIISA